MAKNGESIYGTRGGPISPRPWGATTRKGDTVYVHVLDWPDATLALPPLPKAVKSARLLVGGRPVTFQSAASGVTLQLPSEGRDPNDTVVVLDLQK
jgi:alpha-L-fucosidase